MRLDAAQAIGSIPPCHIVIQPDLIFLPLAGVELVGGRVAASTSYRPKGCKAYLSEHGVPNGRNFVSEGHGVPGEEHVSIVEEGQVQPVSAVVHFEVHDRGIILQ